MEIGIDSYVSSCPHLGLVNILSSFTKEALSYSVLFKFWMHTHRPECAIGLVVTRRKMSNFLLVTTAPPVCT